MRSIWSGTLSFGLVNIPIQLYSGSQSSNVDLTMLHDKDLSPIRYAKICKLEDKEVPHKEIVKGYEYKQGEYVTISDEDFEDIAWEKKDTIDIQFFMNEGSVDTVYFDKPYFLEPGKGGAKAYTLLREALKKSKKVALVQYVLRNRIHYGVLKIFEDALLINQLRFKSEIRSSKELSIPEKSSISKKELEMALQLVEQLVDTFQPEKYEDTYAHDLESVIQAKLKGKKAVSRKKKKKREEIETKDLMEKLKESLLEKNSGKKVRKAA
ncbi:MAG: hypothetical protein Tsb0021_09290 [Chlamydiales bacterium]